MAICINKYILDSFLGSGAFGNVYKVFNQDIKETTAIKVIKREDFDVAIMREINILKKLSTGYCQLGNMKGDLFYEMTLANSSIEDFIRNKNRFEKLIQSNLFLEKFFFYIMISNQII